MNESFLKVLEVANINNDVYLPVPTTIVQGFGIRKLTYIRFSDHLEFTRIDLPSLTEIISSWASLNKQPLCCIKPENQHFYKIEEVLSRLETLISSETDFILQKHIESSDGTPNIIRITQDPRETTFQTLTPQRTYNSTLSEIKALRANKELSVKSLNSKPPSKTLPQSSSLSKYLETVKYIVENFMLKRPVTHIECDFLVDRFGQYYFSELKSFRSVKAGKSKQRLIIRPEFYSNKRAVSVHPKLINIRNASYMRLKPRPNAVKEEVVSGIMNKNKNLSLKHFTYTSWAKRLKEDRKTCFLDQQFAKRIAKVKVNSPNSTLGTLKGMIHSMNDNVSLEQFPAKLIVREVMRFLLNRLTKNTQKNDPFSFKEKEEIVSISIADVDDATLRILTLKRARKLVDSCSYNLDKIRHKSQEGNQYKSS